MKKLFLLSALIVGSLSFNIAKAQIGIHVNLNLGPRPVYVEPAPVVNDDYYYLPDAEAYYSVPEHVYYYQNEGRWVSGPRLVGRYHDYDYNQLRHFEVNEARPYLRNDYYRARFNNQQFARHDDRGFKNQNYGRPNYRNDYHAQNRFDQRDQRNNYSNSNYRKASRDNRDDNRNNWNRH